VLALGFLTACAEGNPLFGFTETDGAAGASGETGPVTTADSSVPMPTSTTVGGGTGDGGTSPSVTGMDDDDDDDETDDDDDESDTDAIVDMRRFDPCVGLHEYVLEPGADEQFPQVGMFAEGPRVFYYDSFGALTSAHFFAVDDPSVETLPGLAGTALLAGGAGTDVAVATGPLSLEVVVGDTDYNFAPPIVIDGTDFPKSGLGKVGDTWMVPSFSGGSFMVSTVTVDTAVPGVIEAAVDWVDGDGTAAGFAYVYERDPPLPTCRIIPFENDETFGSNSTAVNQECRTPTLAYDPMVGGLMVYARSQSETSIRGVRIGPDANPTPSAGGHFQIIAAKGVDHPDVVRLPASGDFWVVFDQGSELTALVLAGDDPGDALTPPKSFGGQADGRLQAFTLDDHPAVAFHTTNADYGPGVHVVVDCDVL